MKQLKIISVMLGVFCLLMLSLSGCVGGGGSGGSNGGGGGGATPTKLVSKEIISFKANDIEATINQGNILAVLPDNTDLTKVNVSFVITGESVTSQNIDSVNIDPKTHTVTAVQDFSKGPLQYVVTAQDGTTKIFTATINITSSTKEIISFTANNIKASINESDILAAVSDTTDLTKVNVSFVITGESVTSQNIDSRNIDPETHTVTAVQDFSKGPLQYVVTAQDGTSKIFTARVATLSSAKEIISYSINGYKGQINQESKTISVIVSQDTDLTALRATFDNIGTVTVDDVLQISEDGTNKGTINNFSNSGAKPLEYKVTAADKSTVIYKVMVTKQYYAYATGYYKYKISTFSLNNITGALTLLNTPILGNGTSSNIILDPSGHYVYAVNQTGNSVSIYSFNPGTGQLEAKYEVNTGGRNPGSITFDPSGKYAYVTNLNSDNISIYSINNSTGQLIPLSDFPTVATGRGPISCTFDPLGHYVYVTNAASNTISQYSLDAKTGKLNPLNKPITTGEGYANFVFSKP
jgi:6-phosphogluconolactonase (cycloisomerase 2 family)